MQPVEDLSFEEALAELETIVETLEREGLELDETVAHYQRGRALAQRCQRLLDKVALEVEQVVADQKGGVRTESFSTETDQL